MVNSAHRAAAAIHMDQRGAERRGPSAERLENTHAGKFDSNELPPRSHAAHGGGAVVDSPVTGVRGDARKVGLTRGPGSDAAPKSR